MTDRSSSLKLRVLTWNVLADCYAKASPSSHATSSLPSYAAQPLPNPSSTSWSSRQDLLERTLFAQTGVDIYTLQEVDHFHDFFQPLFARRGYQTLFAQRPRKQDGCLIAYRDNQHELIASEIIDLDRLAYLDQTKDNFAKNCTSRFAKQNLALLACFQNKLTKQYFLIITCHIHWNPNLPEVKFAQVTMILQEIQLFLASRKHLQNMPILWSGDFNSFPTDEIYDYITSMQSRSLQIHQKYHQMMFQQVSFGNSFLFGPNTKFLCESSLIRLSRWMRMLGVNVAMGSWEVANSTSATKQQAIQAFFQRAKDEKRVILTTSRTLTERGNCPQSFFVNPSRLEDGLIAIYRQFGLALQRERFLTVCGKCGGEIQEANLLDPRLMGKILPCDRAVFMCIACAQPYWWNEEENSSPAKAMKRAEELYVLIKSKLFGEQTVQEEEETVASAGAEVDNTSSEEVKQLNDRFAIRDQVILQKQLAETTEVEEEEASLQTLSITEVSVETEIEDTTTASTASTLVFKSVFGSKEQEPPLTNWNGEFKGTLDYIFLNGNWNVKSAFLLPHIEIPAGNTNNEVIATIPPIFESTEEDSNLWTQTLTCGQPSLQWPSDHFMIVTELELQ